MNDEQWARIEAKRERNRYFTDLEQKARTARYRPVREPREPKPRPARKGGVYQPTGRPRGGREQVYLKCSGCDRPFRTRTQRKEDHPGSVLLDAEGKCKVCRLDSPRKGMMGRPRLRPDNCIKCDQPMRDGGRQKLADFPGTVVHGKGGVCRPCLKG